MAVTANWFGAAATGQWGSTAARRVDWASDTIKVALTTSSYTPNQDTHAFFSDVTNEITGAGYTAGGATLASRSVTYDSASNETRLDADDVAWAAASFTCRRAVVYKDTGTPSSSPLLGWVDFGGDQAVSGATFQIVWDATGVLKATVA